MVGLGVLSACTSEKIGVGEGLDDGLLHLVFSKEGQTKADVGADGSGNFSEGDRIGLYIGNGDETQYRELTYAGGQWTPELRRSDFGSGELTLSAHFPAVTGPDGTSVDCGVAADQSGEGFASSDLLVAQTTLPEGKYEAGMTFRHAFHRLKISLEGNADDVTLSIRSLVSGTVDLLTGEVSGVGGDYSWITPKENADGSYAAVILPQAASPYQSGDGLVKIVSGDKTAYFAAPSQTQEGSPLESFLPGKETAVNLQIKVEGGPDDPQWAGRKVWVKGVQAAPQDAWVQLYPDLYYTYYLPWDESYGWYDCNKRNPSGTAGGVEDGSMCWAAAASNLLHWWIDQNMEYIKRYGDRYKGPDYVFHSERTNDGGFQNTTRQESDIFQCFIDAFDDEGGRADEGVAWFIQGIRPSAPAIFNGNQGGYFKDVFPENVVLTKNVAGLGKEVFNQTVKDALSTGKGMGVSIGDVRSSHVVTIWGVEFDDNGDVSYMYMADNNDRENYESRGIGCLRLQIVYETLPEGATMAMYKSGYIDNNKSIVMKRLVTVDLGQKYWEEYLQKNGL